MTGFESGLSRRDLIRRAIAGGVLLSVPPAALAACGGSSGTEASSTATTGASASSTQAGETAVAKGGRLRVAVTGGAGGGNTETLDPFNAFSRTDVARTKVLYDRLADWAPDGSTQLTLAETLEPNANADEWTMKLKQGVTFHDGKPVTADDVIYSYGYVLSNEFQGAADISMVDPKAMRKVDDTTVAFGLLYPYALFENAVASRSVAIVPDGFTDFAAPNGTGPFKFQSFTPGQESLFVRNPDYWNTGFPIVDELQILSIADSPARINALLAGQVDAIESVDLAQVQALESNDSVAVLESETSHWVPITVSVIAPPFDDPRVRQALRLAINREEIVSQALLGHGFVGNDLFCPTDPLFAADLPPRPHDPEQAKSLLKQAGQEGLTFDLHTSDAGISMLESALLFAEQAKAAGITVNIKKYPADSYWNDAYLKFPVAQSEWNEKPLDQQIAACVTSDAPYNETSWKRPDFDRIALEARETLDDGKRQELLFEAQKELYDEGGYIIWGFANFVDAYSTKVSGAGPHSYLPLTYYGFDKMAVAS